MCMRGLPKKLKNSIYTYDNNDQHRVQRGVHIEEGPKY